MIHENHVARQVEVGRACGTRRIHGDAFERHAAAGAGPHGDGRLEAELVRRRSDERQVREAGVRGEPQVSDAPTRGDADADFGRFDAVERHDGRGADRRGVHRSLVVGRTGDVARRDAGAFPAVGGVGRDRGRVRAARPRGVARPVGTRDVEPVGGVEAELVVDRPIAPVADHDAVDDVRVGHLRIAAGPEEERRLPARAEHVERAGNGNRLVGRSGGNRAAEDRSAEGRERQVRGRAGVAASVFGDEAVVDRLPAFESRDGEGERVSVRDGQGPGVVAVGGGRPPFEPDLRRAAAVAVGREQSRDDGRRAVRGGDRRHALDGRIGTASGQAEVQEFEFVELDALAARRFDDFELVGRVCVAVHEPVETAFPAGPVRLPRLFVEKAPGRAAVGTAPEPEMRRGEILWLPTGGAEAERVDGRRRRELVGDPQLLRLGNHAAIGVVPDVVERVGAAVLRVVVEPRSRNARPRRADPLAVRAAVAAPVLDFAAGRRREIRPRGFRIVRQAQPLGPRRNRDRKRGGNGGAEKESARDVEKACVHVENSFERRPF